MYTYSIYVFNICSHNLSHSNRITVETIFVINVTVVLVASILYYYIDITTLLLEQVNIVGVKSNFLMRLNKYLSRSNNLYRVIFRDFSFMSDEIHRINVWPEIRHGSSFDIFLIGTLSTLGLILLARFQLYRR